MLNAALYAVFSTLSNSDVWDLVAYLWESNTTTQVLTTGKQLYAANCAACHGASGAGDGPTRLGALQLEYKC